MKKIILIALKSLIFTSLFVSFAFAGDNARIIAGANKLYGAGKYDEALKSYNEALISNPDSYAINYNMGAAYFKKGEYEKAISAFEKASISSDKSLESKANYNIGNSKYKLGKLKKNTDLSNTVKLLREALDYYKRAIELESNDNDAKINHELVEKELKILLDKLKQEQENKDKQKEQGQQESPKNKPQAANKSENQAQEQKSQKENQTEAQKQDNEANAKNEQKQREEKMAQMNKTQEENKEQIAESNETASMLEESQEMSAQEAKMLLDGYRQEENAKGKIKDTTRGYPADVLKDW